MDKKLRRLATNIIFLNIRSIRNIFEELKMLIESIYSKIDILILTGTWLYQSETNFYNIHGYTSIHNCRESRAGEVAVYIKNGLNFEEINQSYFDDKNGRNVILFKIQEYNIMICAIYRQPSSSQSEFLEGLNNIMEIFDEKGLICGDTNINLLNMETNTFNYYNRIIEMNEFRKEIKFVLRKVLGSPITL